jgi:excisionase family DNA binding protein
MHASAIRLERPSEFKFERICAGSERDDGSTDGERKMEASQRFFNVSEAADFLGVSAASLRKWSDQGLVQVYRTPGGQRRYSPGDLEEFLSSMRQPAEAVPRYGRNANSVTG